MATSPRLSVIVPVYNAETYLHRCVDSILQQSYTDFELILVDDGSSDKSGEICDTQAQKDSRVHVIHQPNSGVSAARNAGLEKAAGEWITFVDADDYLEQGFFCALENPQADLLLQSWKSFGDIHDYTEPMPTDKLTTPTAIKAFLTQHLNTLFMRTPWGKFYRKEHIGQFRFDTSLVIGEDTVFFFEYLSRCSSLQVCNTASYMYLLRFNDRRRNMAPKEALSQFHAVYKAYRKLNVNAPEYLKSTFFYYRFLCSARCYRKVMFQWYDDPIVREARKAIQKEMSGREIWKYAWKRFLAHIRKMRNKA